MWVCSRECVRTRMCSAPRTGKSQNCLLTVSHRTAKVSPPHGVSAKTRQQAVSQKCQLSLNAVTDRTEIKYFGVHYQIRREGPFSCLRKPFTDTMLKCFNAASRWGENASGAQNTTSNVCKKVNYTKKKRKTELEGWQYGWQNKTQMCFKMSNSTDAHLFQYKLN